MLVAQPSSACGALTATDQGVTPSTITVGIVLVDLAAANSLLSIPSASNQKKAYEAILGDLNRKGGIRCRKVVGKYYTPNPLSADAEHSACLSMAQDKVFAVFNNLVSNTEQTCIAKAKIPNFWYTPPHLGDVRKYSPYIISSNPDFDRLIHQYVFASKSLGFFTGMKKLGLLVGTCFPDEQPAVERELRAVGIDPSKASVFNYGCESLPSPTQEQNVALQLKAAGVTHVVNVAYAHDSNLSQAGDQQDFHPKYTHMDDASPAAIESASQPPGDSFDNTLLITTTQEGAAHTPGYKHTPATVACTKLLASAGLPSPYSPGLNALYGVACNNAAMLKAAAEAAPSLTRLNLSTGLVRAGRLDLSFPASPFHLTDARRPTGGDVWRPGVWKTSCECWQVTNLTFRSTY
ncbi:MAG: hypothetical protein JWO12_1985 [Frankiales bacterium]|nr:hypothetical protein [Frankiales bacterium]